MTIRIAITIIMMITIMAATIMMTGVITTHWRMTVRDGCSRVPIPGCPACRVEAARCAAGCPAGAG